MFWLCSKISILETGKKKDCPVFLLNNKMYLRFPYLFKFKETSQRDSKEQRISATGDHTYSRVVSPRTGLKTVKKQLGTAKRKLYTTTKRLKRVSSKLTTLEEVITEMKKQNLLSEDLERKLESFGELPNELFEGWTKNQNKCPSGRRYTEKMRKFATTLHYHSPKAYTYLATIFPMPSVQTLRTWLKVVDGWPGFTHEAIEHLKKLHQNTSQREKLCSIMLDGMSIRKKCDFESKTGRLIGYIDFGEGQSPLDSDDVPLATDALVLMAVGVASPWKIPIGYFLDNGLSGEALKSIVT